MNKAPALSNLITWFVNNPIAANLLMVLVILLGISSLQGLKTEAYPDINFPFINVYIPYEGGSAEATTTSLTKDIEKQLAEIDDIRSFMSTSDSEGITFLIECIDSNKVQSTINKINDTLSSQKALRNAPKRIKIDSHSNKKSAIQIQIHGNTDQISLQKLAQELHDDLQSKSTIKSVEILGWKNPILIIKIKPELLQLYDIKLKDIEDKLVENFPKFNSITEKKDGVEYRLSTINTRIKDLTKFEIGKTGSTNVLLGDIAKIQYTTSNENKTVYNFNGKPSIGLNIYASQNSSLREVVEEVNRVKKEWKSKNKASNEVFIESWLDQSKSISPRINNLKENAILGAFLVFIVLFVFINIQTAFWVTFALPFIFFGTFFLMNENILDLTLNELTILGFIMAIGIVVDDSVVVSESIHFHQNKLGKSAFSTIQGTLDVTTPTIFGALTTVTALFAISNIEGFLGQLYSQYAIIVSACLLLSVIESKLILPSHLRNQTSLLTKEIKIYNLSINHINKPAKLLLEKIEKTYSHLLKVSLPHHIALLILFISIFIYSLSLPFSGKIGLSFFPSIFGDNIYAYLTMEEGSSNSLTKSHLENLLFIAEETQNTLSPKDKLIRNHLLETDRDGNGQITLELKANSVISAEAFSKLWKNNSPVPIGAEDLSITSTTDIVQQISIKLFAHDINELMKASNDLQSYISSIQSITSIKSSNFSKIPGFSISVKPLGKDLGFTKYFIMEQLIYHFGEREVDINIYGTEINRALIKLDTTSLKRHTLQNTIIYDQENRPYPLYLIANLDRSFHLKSIDRQNGKLIASFTIQIDKTINSTDNVSEHINKNIRPALESKYPGITMELGGEAEQKNISSTSMKKLSLIAVAVIFALLAIPLRSYSQPLIILSAIPFGIVGALLGHWIHSVPLGILSFNGMIALSGIVVNDSLLLLHKFNKLKSKHADISIAIHTACITRFKAIILTTITTFIGLLPLILSNEKESQYLVPAGVSIAYGIVFSSAVTLFLIPALLKLNENISIKLRRTTLSNTL